MIRLAHLNEKIRIETSKLTYIVTLCTHESVAEANDMLLSGEALFQFDNHEAAKSQNDSKQTKPRGSITKNPQPDPSHSTVCRSQSGKCDN